MANKIKQISCRRYNNVQRIHKNIYLKKGKIVIISKIKNNFTFPSIKRLI